MPTLILLAAALTIPPAMPVTYPMAALYNEICLQTFPIDARVDALMAAKGATPLTVEEVKVTLRDDPGRGWRVESNPYTMVIFLELPPFHACSVRAATRNVPLDMAPYRKVADAYKATHGGFAPQKPMDADMGAIHMHAEQDARGLPGGGSESLMVIGQHIIDAARRAQGETGTMFRFVHQINVPN